MDAEKNNPSMDAEKNRAEGNVSVAAAAPNHEEREAPNEEQGEAPNQEENVVENKQEAVQAPHPIPPPHRTLNDAERRLKRQRKAERSTMKRMVKRAKHGVHTFSKNIMDDTVKQEEDEDDIGEPWDHEEKWSDDDVDPSSPDKVEVPSD